MCLAQNLYTQSMVRAQAIQIGAFEDGCLRRNIWNGSDPAAFSRSPADHASHWHSPNVYEKIKTLKNSLNPQGLSLKDPFHGSRVYFAVQPQAAAAKRKLGSSFEPRGRCLARRKLQKTKADGGGGGRRMNIEIVLLCLARWWQLAVFGQAHSDSPVFPSADNWHGSS